MLTRKEVLSSAGVAAAAFLTKDLLAEDHSHHHHEESKYASVLSATSDCIVSANLCLSHCLILLSKGEKEMAECASAVVEMKALCESYIVLASKESKLLSSFTKICIQACSICEKACGRHAEKHSECKDCMEQCQNCIKEMKAVA
jgi:Cys-rich four helix bundle protein (predicted Tat secretion target)